MRLLHGFGADKGARDREEFTLELDRVGRPDGLQSLERLLEAPAAILPRDASGHVLVSRPALSEPDPQPSIREDVDRRQTSREQYRAVPRKVQDGTAKGDPARL